MEKPNYIAKKSAWAAVTFWRVVLFWLIIPLIIMIVDIIIKKHEVIEFYDGYVVKRSGVIARKEKRSTITGIVGVSMSQTIFGRMCNYGDVMIDFVGKSWDISTKGIANAKGLKEYLEPLITKSAENMKSVVVEY